MSVRVKINNSFGFEETAILPITPASLQVKFNAMMAHYADGKGKLLLSIDLQDNAVNFADPSVTIEHKFEGKVQLFRGNFISLIPIC